MLGTVVRRQSLDHNMFRIFLARCFLSACQALGAVLIPIYLTVLGFSAVKLGMLFLAVTSASAILSTAVGIVSDRIGRKPFLVGIPLVVAVAGIILAFTTNPVVLFIVIPLSSFGRGFGAGAGSVTFYQPAEAAYVMGMSEPSKRNQLFARLTFASSLGSVIGNAVVGGMSAKHLHAGSVLTVMRPFFLISTGLSLMAALSVIKITEEPRDTTPVKRHIMPVRSSAILRRFIVSNGVTGLAIGVYAPFISYWFFKVYAAGPGEIGRLFAVANVVAGISSLGAGAVARRYGSVWTVFWLRLGQSVLFFAMVYAHHFLLAGVFYTIYVVGQRVGIALRQSYVVAMADPSERGAVVALSNLPSEVAQASMSPVAGWLIESSGLLAPFLVSASLQFLNGFLYLWMFLRHRPDDELAKPIETARVIDT
ncbi:MAG TPA: MFS transporter [Acidimicrobiales bacterium]|nr:MFS transporter [Acidimicrobiales bacterium]